MKKFLFLLSLGLLFACNSIDELKDGDNLSDDACGVLGLNTRIINGTECSKNTSPVVLIEIEGLLSGLTIAGGNCTGTLVTRRHILTAAHCFTYQGGANGETSIFEEARIIVTVGNKAVAARSFSVHPRTYIIGGNPPKLVNDVAVIELSEDAPSSIKPIPILTSREPVAGDRFAIYGYGEDENQQIGILKSGEMRISSVTAYSVEAEFDKSGTNTCFGDSGGPAIYSYTNDAGKKIVGIMAVTSSGIRPDCKRGDISVFASVQRPETYQFLTSVIPNLPTI